MDATKINKIPKIETVHHNEMYCAFIDVLGYSALVSDEKISVGAKIKKLKSIYENLAANIAPIINEINNSSTSNIYIKSFSDCFYLESSDIHPILIAVNRLFNWTFGYYKNFSFEEEWTPLLRAGIVKDWTLRFKDIGAIVNDTVGENPVGYGVARAYGVSEKSGLSGMRIIISPEVIADLNLLKLDNPLFRFLDIKESNVLIRYFFKYISQNEAGEKTDLYELIWPDIELPNCTYDYFETLIKLHSTIPEEHKRHFIGTAKVILDGLLLTNCTRNVFEEVLFKIRSYANFSE